MEEERNTSGITRDYEEQNLINGKMVISRYQILEKGENRDNFLLSFEFENKKKIQVLKTETILFYVFTDASGKIELLFNDTFKYSNRENTLSFTNQDTEYIIYDDKITVKTPSKTFDMKAVKNTKLGTLSKIKTLKLDNVIN